MVQYISEEYSTIFTWHYVIEMRRRGASVAPSSSAPCGQFHQHFKRSFYAHRCQKHKNTVKPSVFFALLGSAWVKAARKLLVKLTPWWWWCRSRLDWNISPLRTRAALFVVSQCERIRNSDDSNVCSENLLAVIYFSEGLGKWMVS